MDIFQMGYPKLNVYEAIEPGGVMIILSECREGLGNEEIREIIQNYDTLLDREDSLRKDYSIAKFVGYYISEIASQCLMILVSKLEPAAVANANIRVVKTIEKALKIAYQAKGERLRTYLMPHGANTLPQIL